MTKPRTTTKRKRATKAKRRDSRGIPIICGICSEVLFSHDDLVHRVCHRKRFAQAVVETREAAEAKLREAEQGAEWSKMMHREQWKFTDAAVEALKEARRWLLVEPPALRLVVETIDGALAAIGEARSAPPAAKPREETVTVPRHVVELARDWIDGETHLAIGDTSKEVIAELTAALDAALRGTR